MSGDERSSVVSDFACAAVAAAILLGLVFIAVRLKALQVDSAADYGYAEARQSIRRVQTDGLRGRILDRRGVVLAGNRVSCDIVCDVARFRRGSLARTVEEVMRAIAEVEKAVGSPPRATEERIRRHLRAELARPLVCWRDVDHAALARFLERSRQFPGFSCREAAERVYPQGRAAAHLVGYVGRDRGDAVAGDEKFNYFEPELVGRAGVERYYNGFLRGVPGEVKVRVDALGYAIDEQTAVEATPGPDLALTLDMRVQRAAERVLEGCRGACVVIDPRSGDVLAMASAPGFDPNDFVPRLGEERYAALRDDPAKPLLNRAAGGTYAPGSTFKPVVALAALSLGVPPDAIYECTGVFTLGDMRLRCASRWGHGAIDMRHAMMKSCNPYFCNLGMEAGTNAVIAAAREFGLGAKTGVDFGVDDAGVVPDAERKLRSNGERWYPGDLAQMSVGQGMLLATPLQMARVAGAIATGRLVTPRLKLDSPVESRPLAFAKDHLDVVREGMRMVVDGDGTSSGTGRRAGEGVAVAVSGKTGTAEIGVGERRRKNAWFIAYAPSENPTAALAIVVENAEGGGVTAAPKAAEVLKVIFGERQTPENEGRER
ncbi:MAG: penicillin-binding protein 2 [Kiritimatiellae bacterium]|nr:penicillin-binding protein 2 [Kiritimatiellia bacterium]